MKFALVLLILLAACESKTSKTVSTDPAAKAVDSVTATDTSQRTATTSLTKTVNLGKFEVAGNDLPDMLTWDLAKSKVEALGCDWRLPDNNELKEIFKNKEKIEGLQTDVYWSSEEKDAMLAYVVDLSTGKLGGFSKIYSARIRPVRTL
jgi:hypothetical protein